MPPNPSIKLRSRNRARSTAGSSRNYNSSRRSAASSTSRRHSSRSRETPDHSVQAFTSHRSDGDASHTPAPPCEEAAGSDICDDTLNEVIMAVDMQHRDTVGCCYYVARDEKLFLMEDAKFGGVEIIDALRVYVDPTIIITSTKTDDSVIERLDPESRSGTSASGDKDQFRLPFLLEVRTPSQFSYVEAKSKLANLKLGDHKNRHANFIVPGDIAAEEPLYNGESRQSQYAKLLRLAGLVDMESRLTIGCAGALLSYLQHKRAAAYLPGDPSAHTMFRISTLEMFSLSNTMFINADTLHSLQILDPESHPNSHNQGPTKASSGSKEGLSVYGLFNHLARTPQGKHLLRQYFLRPSLDLDVINERLDTISAFVRPPNSSALSSLVGSLKSVGNMKTMMIGLRKGVSGGTSKNGGFSGSVWAGIRRFTFHALKIKDALQDIVSGEDLPIKTKVFERFDGRHLAQVGTRISETVDFDKSSEEGRTIILPGVDEELDHMKRTFAGLDDLLSRVARKLSERIPSDVQGSLNVIYFPQIGFLTTVPLDPATGAAVYEGSFENPWERMFSTEDQVYFKNSEVREMDSHFGDLYGIISDREIEISHELAQYVLEYEESLTTISDICGELDSLVALAQGAKLYNLSRPQMTHENVIHIERGRHILQELAVSSFVENDIDIVGGGGKHDSSQSAKQRPSSSRRRAYARLSGPSMLILTGPNYSGKSVYLKQTALIVYMAHIGGFVPAASARIGVTDKILSRVATRETVSKMQSAFTIDLQQISMALSLATRRTLLIIDEFGKGTDSSDGAGLACAIFKHLLSLDVESPKVIAATHFHEIFEVGLLRPSPALAFGHLQVCINESASRVEEQITYLYTFKDGRSNSSFGTCCAAMNGVPEDITQRADELILLAMRGQDLVAACSVMPQFETAELEEAERIARDFLEADILTDPKFMLSEILTISTTTTSHC